MSETIIIEPNYKLIHDQFKHDALARVKRFARKGEKAFTRREVYGLLSAINIALHSVTEAAVFDSFRNELQDASVKVFDQVNSEEGY